MNATRFSIVIPACNEGDWVRRTVDAVQASKGAHPLEIIVVDDGSTDGSCDVLRASSRPGVRVLPGGDLGVAGARNLGAANAEGEYLVFLDAHVLPEPGWLDELAAVLAAPNAGLAGLPVRSYDDGRATGYLYTFTDENLSVSWLPAAGSDPYEVPAVAGTCCGARRTWFEDVGGFDPLHERYGLEDVELSLRAWFLGSTCVVSPRVAVVHRFRSAGERGFAFSWDQYDLNLVRYALTYLSGRRVRTVLQGAEARPSGRDALAKVAADDTFWSWRDGVRRRFVHDDEWYFRKFAGSFQAFERRIEDIERAAEVRGDPLRASRCARCGATNIGHGPHCLRCGGHLAEGPEPAGVQDAWRMNLAETPSGGRVCGNCGATLRERAAFCTSCGVHRRPGGA